MDGPKRRHKQFTQERKTKLKPRDNENKNSNAQELLPKVEEEARKKQSDTHESNAKISDLAKQIREYRKQ